MENIDDDCEVYGIHFVKISDNSLAKRYGIKAYPALIYFRNGNPLIYDGNLLLFINVCLNYKCLNTLNFILSGFFISFQFNSFQLTQVKFTKTFLLIALGDLRNEDAVLDWLIDDANRELADEIEDVNGRMLDKLIDESPFLAVLFYDDECDDCDEVLKELEV